jgi:hypothetical protein
LDSFSREGECGCASGWAGSDYSDFKSF